MSASVDAGNHEKRARAAVFGLTWAAYASYYLARKNFSVVKARLSTEMGLTKTQLGDIDTGYLGAYCVGQFLSGLAGDRIGARRLVGFGMLLSAAACAAFGAGSGALAFGVAFALNGIFQATGWPGTVKAMGQWFGPRQRGTVMGVWSTCFQAGGLISTAVATWLLVHHGWRSAFFVPAAWVGLYGILILAALPERASSAPDPVPVPSSAPDDPPRAILRSPILWSLGGAYFCLKLIRYSILFWLPFYLRTALGYSEGSAGYLSISFEVGGIAGAVTLGLITDRWFPGRRRTVAATMIAGLAGALLLYPNVSALGWGANFAGMALIGFCLFGPDTIICGAAAQDLGGAHGVATAAGVINGLGSMGAILQGRITSGVADAWGWDALFRLFAGLAIVASIALAAVSYRSRPASPSADPGPGT